jgi:transglutaminase-like putative cysteine protease
MISENPASYLGADAVINWDSPEIRTLADSLGVNQGKTRFAREAYNYVRDEIQHSLDAKDRRVTVTATQTLQEKVGLCFSKTHLLAALLRSQGIPTGFCYQRLNDGEGGFAIHGLVATYLDDQWHRQDPRGNKPGVNAQFSVIEEQLAWSVDGGAGEIDYPTIFTIPHPAVIAALKSSEDMLIIARDYLPSEL